MRKEKLICPVCGYDNIVSDAYASWNVESQSWELHSTYDDKRCLGDHCSYSGNGKWIEIKEEG